MLTAEVLITSSDVMREDVLVANLEGKARAQRGGKAVGDGVVVLHHVFVRAGRDYGVRLRAGA